jgi:LPXTG-site transpeptidase (sortase) family protein
VATNIVGVPLAKGAWDLTWLWNQVGWLQGTAYPTWSGNSVITGHVYLPNGLPGPFSNIEKLRWGDTINVEAYGKLYTYEVRSNTLLPSTDMSPFKHETKPWLTLVTCKGFNEATNSYRYRVAVRAVLISISDISSFK